MKRILIGCAAAALLGAGCEVHEHEAGYVGVGVGADVGVVDTGGPVIEGAGVTVIDVEPDPAQRVYIYDEGYPPGTYIYNGYYYYGGYRYPRDVFVDRYVRENIRQHRFSDPAANRRQGQPIETRQRQEFSQNHGHRAARPEQGGMDRRNETPARPNNIERPENRGVEQPRPNAIERPENRQPPVERRPEIQRPENRPPTEERRPEVQRPENRPEPQRENVERHENRPANQPNREEKREEKREER